MKELLQKKRGRKLLKGTAVCAACLLFLLSGISGWAAKTGNVQVDSVNVRTEAGAESARVCKLPANTTVNIVDEKTGNDGKVWYHTTFLLEGAEKTGWIRSDMLTVTEQQEPEEAPAAVDYMIQEPIESYAASEALSQTTVSVGEELFTAWQVDTELTGGQELYLVSAARADGSVGWFYYDPAEETFQRDMGQFSDRDEGEPEGLILALQKELTDLKETSESQLSMRLYIMIGLAVLCVILLILVIVFGLKYRNAAYEYYDEDEEEDDDEDGDEDGDDEEDEADDEEDEADDDGEEDFASFFTKKKKVEEAAEPESDEEFADEQLPEIDMSAVLEIEEAAKHEEPQAVQAEEPAEEKEAEQTEEDPDDFDIEILDWEDLGL